MSPPRQEALSVAAMLDGGLEPYAHIGIVPTGFHPLDTVLDGGLRAGDLVLVGGLPGVGKTIAMMQWARAAAEQGAHVVYVCYEHNHATLLARLLLMEIGHLRSAGGERSDAELRRLVMDLAASRVSLAEAVADNLVLRAAKARLEASGELLWLHEASPNETTVDAIEELLPADGAAVVFVDYLQKVPTGNGVAGVAVGLKDLALRTGSVVVAAVAAQSSALDTRRLRLHHLDEAAAVGYEADLVLLMNDKALAVSKLHTAFDGTRLDEFRRHVVISVEKHRDGPRGIDLEFEKDFTHYRFNPEGRLAEDRLVDGVFYHE